MIKGQPSVLVSSTFYDLRQVREDLRRFISDDLGYRPLLSEHPSFPIDPDVDTIENCRRRVTHDADIVVLVVGGRYGYVDKSTAKSVTNLEYLAARAKGIPVFAFVEKRVMALLPMATAIPRPDFTIAGIDDARVFEFINQVRSEDRVWTGEFEVADDLIQALRIQFAYLMNDGLRLNHLVRKRSELEKLLETLSPAALRIVLERPEAWEHRLWAQVWSDQVVAVAEARYLHKQGLALGLGEAVSEEAVFGWFSGQLRNLARITLAVDRLIKEILPEAWGPPGQDGDPQRLVFAARAIGQAYQDLIEWSQRVRRTVIPERFVRLRDEMSRFTDNNIERLESMGPDCLRMIEQAMASPPDDPRRTIRFKLVLDVNLGRFAEELQKLADEKKNDDIR